MKVTQEWLLKNIQAMRDFGAAMPFSMSDMGVHGNTLDILEALVKSASQKQINKAVTDADVEWYEDEEE
jgi:hypothetical protein